MEPSRFPTAPWIPTIRRTTRSIHGAGRFLVLARDEEAEPNLVWKDTVLVRTGQVVDILFDVTNPGLWMAHCHIAEHMQSGMMFSFVANCES
jgi:FtsP/CotA-like multicopper oxidase with cupredoxin domain